MVEQQRVDDPAFRAALVGALERAGEVLIAVSFAYNHYPRKWYLARDEAELDAVLARIPTAGEYGRSDRIEAYATGALPHRAASNDPWLHERATELLQQTGEVMLACRNDDDPELHDVDETDELDNINEWFRQEYEGEHLVGSHPYLQDEVPGAAVFVAYNLGDGGVIHAGPY
jgi:hypothetical protein